MVAFGLPVGAALADAPDEWSVVVNLKEHVLADDFSVLVDDREIYLPLVDLSALLLIPVARDSAGYLTGTVSSTEHTFGVNPALHLMRMDGVSAPLKASDIRVADNRVYVASAVLDKLIPLHIAFDRRAVSVKISADAPLPIEVRWRQQELRARILDATAEKVEPTRIPQPYALLSPPVGDVNITTEPIGSDGAKVAYNALLGAEVGYLSGQLFVSGDDNHYLRDARIAVGRESPEGGVFGLAPVTEAWAGDITPPSLQLVGSGAMGRGALISTMPLDRPDAFDKTTVAGDANPGWGVELYQNGLLIAYQVAGSDGRYQFDDVALFYGTNVFRLAFYGPQGETREETRKVTVGGAMTPPGETLTRAYVGQPGERALQPLLSQTSVADSGLAFSYELEHGVSQALSTRAYVTRAPVSTAAGSDLALTTGIGAIANIGNASVNGDVAIQGSGYAFDVGAIGALNTVSLSASYSAFNQFFSPAASDGLDPLTSIETIRAMKSVPSSAWGPLVLGASEQYETYVDGRGQMTAGFDVRQRIKGVYLDHGLDVVRTTYDGVTPTSLSLVYNAATSAFLDPYWLHAGARINLVSGDPFENFSASILRRFGNDAAASVAVNYAPVSSAAQIDLNYSRQYDISTVSGHVSLDNHGEVAIGLGLSFSLGSSREQKPFLTSQRIAENGAIAPFVYHDVNADGRFEPGVDEPLPGVAIRGSGAGRAKTDGNGDALLTGLSLADPVTVDVDRRTLPDPFLVPAKGPVVVDPRPGKVTPVDIAIVDGGEISGTVSSTSDDTPIGGIGLRVVAGDGHVAGKTTTLSDGSYLFEGIPPGAYRVEIVAGQTLNDKRIAVRSKAARVAANGNGADDLDFSVPTGAPANGGAGATPTGADGAAKPAVHFEEADP